MKAIASNLGVGPPTVSRPSLHSLCAAEANFKIRRMRESEAVCKIPCNYVGKGRLGYPCNRKKNVRMRNGSFRPHPLGAPMLGSGEYGRFPGNTELV